MHGGSCPINYWEYYGKQESKQQAQEKSSVALVVMARASKGLRLERS